MNAREGMRRLGIVLGIAGGIVGVIVGYINAQGIWKTRMAYRKFESTMALPTMQEVAKAIKEHQTEIEEHQKAKVLDKIPDPTDDITINVDLEGIKTVLADKTGRISSVELSTGETLHRTERLTLLAYLAPFFYPGIGFLGPWGSIRLLTWVGTGFVEAPRN